jgi:hypothetical protein
MLSPKRLVVGLAMLSYGAIPASTASCDFGPDELCSKRGQECGLGCCEGLACDDATGKCVTAASRDSEVMKATAQGPP